MDFINKIFDSADSVLAKNGFNGIVRFKGNSLLIDLSESSFKYESSDSFSGWVSVSDEGLNSSEHIS